MNRVILFKKNLEKVCRDARRADRADPDHAAPRDRPLPRASTRTTSSDSASPDRAVTRRRRLADRRCAPIARAAVGAVPVARPRSCSSTSATASRCTAQQPDARWCCRATTERGACAIVRACRDAGVPFVPRGAGTGLSGGAVAVEGGVVIECSRMDRILEVDRRGPLRGRAARRRQRRALDARSRRTASSTRPIPRASSRARSAATSPRTRAARTR